tara:strand:+ start:80 stop:277 length:198 start_codon:yes stop_codon:yes gene_type:complete
MPNPVTIAIVLLIVVIIYQHYQIHIIHAELDNIIDGHNNLVETTADMVVDVFDALEGKEDKTYGD